MAGIDKGSEIPPLPEIFKQRSPDRTSPGSLLRTGLIPIFDDAAVIAAMSYAMHTLSLWGLILIGVGSPISSRSYKKANNRRPRPPENCG